MAADRRAEIAASAAALQDLGPGYEQALAEDLVERIGAEIDQRIAAEIGNRVTVILGDAQASATVTALAGEWSGLWRRFDGESAAGAARQSVRRSASYEHERGPDQRPG